MAKLRESPGLRDKTSIFEDREEAGRLLADKLEKYRNMDALLFAIPAGGVPVGFKVSEKLDLEFYLLLVRKLHIPWNPEAGFGSITWDGESYYNENLLKELNLSEKEIKKQEKEELKKLEEKRELFLEKKYFPDVKGKKVIIVDDGLASGFTMLAAVKSVQKRRAKKTIIATSTGSLKAIKRLTSVVDEIVCLNVRTSSFFAVANAYKNWYDLRDEEVLEILQKKE